VKLCRRPLRQCSGPFQVRVQTAGPSRRLVKVRGDLPQAGQTLHGPFQARAHGGQLGRERGNFVSQGVHAVLDLLDGLDDLVLPSDGEVYSDLLVHDDVSALEWSVFYHD
jgi:hypothetical protein